MKQKQEQKQEHLTVEQDILTKVVAALIVSRKFPEPSERKRGAVDDLLKFAQEITHEIIKRTT